MSFTYGGVHVDSLGGDICATPVEYPSQGGLEVDTLSTPGRDGRYYGGTRREAKSFEFEVTITGQTQAEAAEVRDDLMALIDPARGPQSLILDDMAEWMYTGATLSAEIGWEKHGWGSPDRKTIYQGTVQFETAEDPTAREIDPTEISFTGSTSYTHGTGTTSSFPRLEVRASGNGQVSSVTVGDVTVGLDGNQFEEDQVLVFDWENMRFSLYSPGGAKIASLVNRMDNFDRPVFQMGETYGVSTSPSRSAWLYPNARRA